MNESGQQREPDRNVDSGNPDVLLDIPKVSVDSIRLAVDGLEADLSLRARVANLLQVDAGVRVRLSGGELDVNGVNAEAQLRVRLEQLTSILGRALDTLDNNPHIIEALARTAGTAVDDANRSAQQLAAGAAEIKASSRRSEGVRDESGRQVGAGPGVGGPGPRAGGPGPADQARPEGQHPQGPHAEGRHPQGREPEAGPPGGHRPDSQRSDGQRSDGQRHEGRVPPNKPGTRPVGRRCPVRARPGATTVVCRVRRRLRPRARRSSPSRRGRRCDRPDAACGRRSRAAWRSIARRAAATTDAAPTCVTSAVAPRRGSQCC
ncbi:hypothetical protein ACQP0U_01090 [Micromonospora sp. CA-269861]|uniref:hypothetical protein n=1 Tax=Micromonospora sp. CA-269861 TaxID=3239968 RepID=UPI003D8B9FCA